MAQGQKAKAAAPAQQEPLTSEKLGKLLRQLNIKAVYYIDDEHNISDFEIEIIVGEIRKIYSQSRQDGLSNITLTGWDTSQTDEGTIESLRTLWTSISIEQKVSYIQN